MGVHLNTVFQALTGCVGLARFPFPPPWGWSQGFLATPRTLGFIPKPLFFPALPIIFLFHLLETAPILEIQFKLIFNCQPEFNFKKPKFSFLLTKTAPTPAALHKLPPLYGLFSTLLIIENKGISFNKTE